MESLRKPFLVVALVLIALVVLLELGRGVLAGIGVLGGAADGETRIGPGEVALLEEFVPGARGSDLRSLEPPRVGDRPPGRAVHYMALVDGLLLFTVGLIGASLLLRERAQARIQGIATLIVGLLVVVAAISAVIAAFVALVLMVGLLLAVPFGTLVYMARYGFFARGDAAAFLSLLMLLKIGFVVCLALAQQRFLQNRGLVLLIITSLLSNVIVGVLHGIVPRFLVSITDTIAAIVVGIMGGLWALSMLILALPSVLKTLRTDRV
jgi:hypothetical protein